MTLLDQPSRALHRPTASSLNRLVSWTTILVVGLSLLALVVPAWAAGSGSQVTGWLDSVTSGDDSITAAGWAADPDVPDQAAGIHIYVDGSFRTGGPASLGRRDVDRVTGLGANHGFKFNFTVIPGEHRVCVYAIDRTGDPNRLLGCATLQVGPPPAVGGSPVGWLDSLTVLDDGVRIRGWALDPDTTASVNVHVYVDGKFKTGFGADLPRPDVDRAMGLGAAHGFNEVIAMHSGWHTVCVFGIDRTGQSNALIDCAPAVIPFDKGAILTSNGIVMPVVATGNGSWTVLTACTNEDTVAFSRATLIKTVDVVIDPGHGGSETGAAANGLVEKTLNLDIAKRLEAILRQAGYDVLLTRYKDYRVPLKTRGAIAQALRARVFVSIHHNGGATNRAGHPGTMTLYQHDLPESRRLATLLWEEMYGEARRHPTSWVSNGLTGASTVLNRWGNDFFGVHRFTPDIPSVITEWGYITNSYEAAQLKTSTVKNAEANAIARAIVKWFETSAQGSGNIGSWVHTTHTGTGGTDGCVDPSLP